MTKAGRVASNRRVGAAAAFIDTRLGAGRAGFSLPELRQESGLSAIAARFQLLRLGGKVVRVSPRQPFFLIVAPEHRGIGAPPVDGWLDDYFRWLGRPYYLALQSAAAVYGSNPQALQVTQVMTNRPLRPIRVGRNRLQFFVKGHIERTPVQQLAPAAAPLSASTLEATVFDLIRYATRIGGIESVAQDLGPLLPGIRPANLRRVLRTENETAVAQRLGFVFQAARQWPLAQIVSDWLPQQLTVIPLSPRNGTRTVFPLVKRWQVLNNAGRLLF